MTNEEFINSIRLDGEEWRDVVGYEGLYMVSSYGRVASLEKQLMRGLGSFIRSPKLLSPIKMNNGYFTICLVKGQQKHMMFIHRIVATSFLPNPNKYPQIDHIDTIKTNNNVSNLRWCTNSQNQLNPKTRVNNSISKKGKPKRREKVVCLNDDIVVKIYDSPISTIKDGFEHSCVVAVCNGKRKNHKGYQWMYLSDYESLINQDVKEQS